VKTTEVVMDTLTPTNLVQAPIDFYKKQTLVLTAHYADDDQDLSYPARTVVALQRGFTGNRQSYAGSLPDGSPVRFYSFSIVAVM
jgi:hypothetical protein